MGLYVERGGSDVGADDPMLVLLHGLGATGAVWHGLLEHWPGAWVVPDLPGHGRSDALPRYTFGGLAAAVAAELEPGRRYVAIGHSLGGVVALALASGWFGVTVSGVCGLGIKVRWTPDDLALAADMAARRPRVFGTREEAADRALRIAGLGNLIRPDSPIVDTALTENGGLWRLALDPAAFGVGAPDMAGLLSACRAARVILAAGELDPMSRQDHLSELVPDPVRLPGLGHNAHVEHPAALRAILDRLHE